MRLAFFGGTFDPPHRGHLAIATAAADAFELDQVLFAPVGVQPLKSGRTHTPYADRRAMVALDCASDPRFSVSDLDAPRPDRRPNYTVNSLDNLRQKHPFDRLFSVSGADSFHDIPHWHQPDRLFELAEWIVVSRPGVPIDLSQLTDSQRAKVHLLETVHEDISATTLRQRLAHNDPCPHEISPPVLHYILQHSLYHHSHQ